jgi:thiol:disulfide interchange protein DsbA
VPVMFQQRWTPLAKIYYTLEALGVESKLSPDVFKAIHGQNVALWDDEKFYDWAATKGIDRNKAKEVFTSFAVDGKMKRALQLAQQYNVQSVPTVVVDGKFVTSSDRVGTHAQLPGAIDELVNKARAERPKG